MPVFSDRGTLLHDYVPASLPHREREIEALRRYLNPLKYSDAGVKVHVVGPVGSGKTVLCRRVCGSLARESEGRLRFAYVNLAFTHRPYHIMASVHRQFLGEEAAGLSPEEMLANILEFLVKRDLRLIVALDEVDAYIAEGRSTKIFYMLARASELEPKAAGKISLVYISRGFNWLRRLDEPTLDTLGRTSAIVLEKYGQPQVRDIIAYRAELAFTPGAVDEEIIDLTAQVSMPYGGVRYALELLYEAGSLAEYEGLNHVQADHVRRAHAAIPKGVNGALYLEDLTLHRMILLKAIFEGLEATKKAYIPLSEAIQLYRVECEQLNAEPEEDEKIKAYVRELATEGYILRHEDKVAAEYPYQKILKTLRTILKSGRVQ